MSWWSNMTNNIKNGIKNISSSIGNGVRDLIVDPMQNAIVGNLDAQKQDKDSLNIYDSFDYLDNASQSSAIGGALGAIPILGDALSSAYDAFSQGDVTKANMMYNYAMAKDTQQYQTSERLASQEYNTAMWNANNEYNSLSSQMKRARDAGVNVNSLFGNGTPVNTSHSAPTTTPMQGGQASVSSISDSYLNRSLERQMMESAIKNTDADTDNKKDEHNFYTLSADERLRGLKLANDKAHSESIAILQKIGIDKIDSDIRQEQNMWLSRMNEAKLVDIYSQINNRRLQDLDLISQMEMRYIDGQYKMVLKDLANEQIKTEKTVQTLNDAKATTEGTIQSLNNANSALVGEQLETQKVLTNKAKEEVVSLNLQNRIDDLKVFLSSVTGVPLGTPRAELDFILYCAGEYEMYYDMCEMDGYRAYKESGSVKEHKGFSVNGSGYSRDVVTPTTNDSRVKRAAKNKRGRSVPWANSNYKSESVTYHSLYGNKK